MHIEPCTCNEMDFECDFGYSRAKGGGPCVATESRLSDAEKKQRQDDLWAEQCDEFGYYEVSQGYRKIPGNICEGGIDLAPYRYRCSTVGYMASFFTIRNLVILLVGGALTYYGWPVIEAVLLFLPIPDPRTMKDKAKEYCNMFV